MFGLKLDRQSQVIVAAYVVFCAGLLITSMFVVHKARLILASAENIYEHPFTVSNSALDAKLTLMTIRRDILFAVLSGDEGHVAQVQYDMARQDARFSESLRQVRAFYLGDMSEVDHTERLHRDWEPVRDRILGTARGGDFKKAHALILSEGTPIYREIDTNLDKIVAFARNKAVFFVNDARAQRDQAERTIYLVLIGGFTTSFICSAFVVRRVRDIVRRNELTLERMAHHDNLTGLPNRQLFMDRLGQALRQAEREERSLAVLYVDLDRFKAVNDTAGHEAGDHLLVAVSKGFTATVRRSDTVARMGGDEFVILLIGPKDQAAIRDVAEKIIAVAATPCEFRGHTLEVGASVGIAVFPSDGRDAEALLGFADKAMYWAKKSGRNGFRFFAEGEQG